MGLVNFLWLQGAEQIPSRSDFSTESYRCTDCGYELIVVSLSDLPPCPLCDKNSWAASA